VNNKFSKQQIATAIAIIFHIVGLIGILVFKSEVIIKSTSFNLLLCFFLLLWTQDDKNVFFWLFAIAAMFVGFAVEVIGVNTGYLFGNYAYGEVLGIQWKAVPLIIAVNWFVVLYCCGTATTALLQRIIKPIADTPAAPKPALKSISIITDGATLALTFDWLMEPVAIKLGYWQWQNNEVPMYNYACWFIISMLLMVVFHFCQFEKRNKFAIHLLLIQVMFFLILRTFLK
jgi:bisanhydrobacterioruberin hydratase